MGGDSALEKLAALPTYNVARFVWWPDHEFTPNSTFKRRDRVNSCPFCGNGSSDFLRRRFRLVSPRHPCEDKPHAEMLDIVIIIGMQMN